MLAMDKRCTRCLLVKDISEFHKNSHSSTGKRAYCKECSCLLGREYNVLKTLENPNRYRDRMREYRKNHKNKDKNTVLKRNYGINLEKYNELFYFQDGCCAICGIHQNNISKPLCVDHDHESGMVRGLLCTRCNIGLGNFKDNTHLLSKAKEYLINRKEY